MNQIFRFFAIISIAFGCAIAALFAPIQPALTIPNVSIESTPRTNSVRDPRFTKHFQELGIEGSIAIYDLNNDRTFLEEIDLHC